MPTLEKLWEQPRSDLPDCSRRRVQERNITSAVPAAGALRYEGRSRSGCFSTPKSASVAFQILSSCQGPENHLCDSCSGSGSRDRTEIHGFRDRCLAYWTNPEYLLHHFVGLEGVEPSSHRVRAEYVIHCHHRPVGVGAQRIELRSTG